jgi:type VI secretion system secreted protein VgrG
VNGTIYAGISPAVQAEADVATAYNTLAGEALTANLTGQDLGTLGGPLTAGVYHFNSSAGLTGTLTLNGPGVFVFQIGSTLTTGTGAAVNLTGGAQADNVFWQVGSSATLGTGTSFNGNILALTAITFNTGTSMTGRALAINSFVTLDNNAVTMPVPVPEPGSFSLLALGASVLGLWRRKAGRS